MRRLAQPWKKSLLRDCGGNTRALIAAQLGDKRSSK